MILDERTYASKPAHVRDYLDLYVKEGMALKISHRAYALSLGRIAIEGECEALRTDDRIRALYLGGEI